MRPEGTVVASPPGRSQDSARGRIELLGVPVDRCSRAEALRICSVAMAQGRGAAQPLQVVTLNPEMVMQSQRDPELRQAICQAGLVVADGAGIIWAAKQLQQPLPERIAGADLLAELAGVAAEQGARLYLLGGQPGVAEEAAQRLRDRHPGLVVGGCLAGSPAETDASEICQRIRESGSSLLAVAFGAPAQEVWLSRYLEASGAALGIGVGGTLDYLSGRVRRAPAPMRQLGLEWLFRLGRQPWRLPRMLRGAPFFWEVWRGPRRGGGQ